jgi:plasmid stability protein
LCRAPQDLSTPHNHAVHLNLVGARNITFSLPADLIREAKIYAARHDTTVNSLVRELLTEALSRESREHAAVERLLKLASHGPYSSVDPGSIRREDLYERR